MILLGTVLLCGLVEAAARVVERVRTRRSARARPYTSDARELLAYYRKRPWGARYWREFVESDRQLYHAGTVWRRAPYTGTTITIDANGIRTFHKTACPPSAYRVFAFGGSAMWGTGAPDSATIPAFLEQELTRRSGTPVCAMNFGESGWVTSQGVAQLIEELRLGQRPDLVVFYEGVNDVYAAYQSGRTDLHQNFSRIAERYEGAPPRSWEAAAIERLLRFSAAARLALSLKAAGTPPPITYRSLGVSRDSLAAGVIATAFANQEIVRALGAQYGFASETFWQPVITEGRKVLSAEEASMPASLDPDYVALLHEVYARAEREGPSRRVHVLTGAFDADTATIWIDWSHVTPEGNNTIAGAMAAAIKVKPVVPSAHPRRAGAEDP